MPERGGRTDIDDRATPAAPHGVNREPGSIHRAEKVGLHDFRPMLQRLARPVRSGGVVDEHAEGAVFTFREFDEGAHLLLHANVSAAESGPAALLFDLPDGLDASILIDIGNHDVCTRAREAGRYGAARSRSAGAGYNHNLVPQRHLPIRIK